MYVLEFCDNPESGELFDGHLSFDDSLSDDYIEHLKALDRFMYLADMFRIVRSCSSDLQELHVGDDIEFWMINKTLINYLNAVYSYKEYVNSYDPPLKEITDGYYYKRKWYRFVCDYRNRVIHQSTIIKDCSTKTGDIFIDLDEMIAIQSDVIAELEKQKQAYPKDQKKYQRQIDNAQRFMQEIRSFDPSPTMTSLDGKRFQSMKVIAHEADEEIASMNDDILMYAYSNGVLPALEWFLSRIHRADDEYKYTFLVNKALIGITEKESVFCYEPTHSIESFFAYMLKCLGKESSVCKAILEWLSGKGYNHSYELDCPITEFAEREGN